MDPEQDEEALWEHHLHVSHVKTRHQKISETSLPARGIAVYFCDWYPKLFGIDEDDIPSSGDEEGLFAIDMEDLEEGVSFEERAKAMTAEQLNRMRVGHRNCMTDDELREAWLREQKPQYGRRARPKIMLRRDNGEEFECICDIDYHYCRHYIPKFGGGVAKEGSELRIPHFKMFWDEIREKNLLGDLAQVPNILEPEVSETQKESPRRHFPKFPGPTVRSIRNFRKQLLSSFRPLQCKEIRRYRMPYVEALYLELQEADCLNGAAFFKNLIIKDHFLHHDLKSTANNSLRKNKEVINKIFEILKLGEKLSRREEYDKEAVMYLKTGLYFNKYEPHWWWLTEEFYGRAVKVSQNCVIDGGKAEAISNYLFGTFLLDCVHRVQRAQQHLLRAREISEGKDWSAGNILKRPEDSVYKESAIYLCRALIAAGKELRKKDKPEEALPLIHRSYKLCEGLGSWQMDIAMEMYFELGLTYQALGMTDWAKIAFSRFLEMAELQNYGKPICDGFLELAICYRSEGNLMQCERNLMSFKTAATIRKNVNLIAFANRYLGEFYLNNGKATEAAELLTSAFTSFLSQLDDCARIPFTEWEPEHFTLPNDVELTRVLTGVAKGETMSKAVCSILLKSENQNDKLLQLIEWRNNPEKFTLNDLKEESVESFGFPSPKLSQVIPGAEVSGTLISDLDNQEAIVGTVEEKNEGVAS